MHFNPVFMDSVPLFMNIGAMLHASKAKRTRIVPMFMNIDAMLGNITLGTGHKVSESGDIASRRQVARREADAGTPADNPTP